MAGPFAGLKVVEFGRFIAAPYCGQLLADGGADVIKVEALNGDETRRNGPILPTEGRQYLNKNRGKRSIAVDLNDADARAAIQTLCAKADIVVANFRPGQAERHHIDYGSLSAVNPRIIYAENTAYGRLGPMADAPGMDIVLSGYSGLISLSEDGPAPIGEPIIDYTAGLLLAWGVSTALYHRERTGRGQKLDVALLQAALVLQNNRMNHIDMVDGWRLEFIDYLKTAFAEGQSWTDVLAKREELQPVAIARSYYGFLPTADGTISVAAMARPLRKKMMEVAGFEDRWSSDPDFVPDDAKQYVTELLEKVQAIFRTQSTDYWVARLSAAGVPAGPMRLPQQLLDDEQVWANGFLVRLEHELLGGLTVVAPPVAFSETPLEARTASPTLGRDSRAILSEAGLSADAIEALRARGAFVES